MAYSPPIGSIYHLYTTYILPSGGLYATYHLLGEPEPTIDWIGKASPFLRHWTPMKTAWGPVRRSQRHKNGQFKESFFSGANAAGRFFVGLKRNVAKSSWT